MNGSSGSFCEKEQGECLAYQLFFNVARSRRQFFPSMDCNFGQPWPQSPASAAALHVVLGRVQSQRHVHMR